jgi:hypothetical protein
MRVFKERVLQVELNTLPHAFAAFVFLYKAVAAGEGFFYASSDAAAGR